ncbi:hypothetical protein EMCRGX_G021589 [Ephydatia muelleri]
MSGLQNLFLTPPNKLDPNCATKSSSSEKKRCDVTYKECNRLESTPSDVHEHVVSCRNICELLKEVPSHLIVTGIENQREKYLNNSSTLDNLTRPQATVENIDVIPNMTCMYPKNSTSSTICMAELNKAIECLHAQDYNTMLTIITSLLPHDIEDTLLCTFGCGLAYYKLSKLSAATYYIKDYMLLSQANHKTADVSLAHVYLGDIAFMENNYITAADHYLKGIKNHGTNNVSTIFKLQMPTISTLYAKQGAALRQASHMAMAVDAFRNSVMTAEWGKDKLSSHNSLGNLLQSLGDHAGALEEYKFCIELCEDLKDYVSLGWTHGNMGNAYIGLHEKDKALYHLKTSLDLVLVHEPMPAAICRAYNNLGTAHQALNELDLAEQNYRLAQTQAVYGNDRTGEGRALGNLGNLFLLRKNYSKAVECYSEVLQLSKERSVVSTVYHNRGCAYYEWAEMKRSFSSIPDLTLSAQELYSLAIFDLRETIRLYEELYQSAKGSSKGLNLSVSLTESNSRTFHRLQDCLVNLEQSEEALVIAESSRARSLGEVLLDKSKHAWPNLRYPLTLNTIKRTVASQECPVVYLSYTGARLLLWLLVPGNSKCMIYHEAVQVDKLEQEKFDGKSFDLYVCHKVSRAAGDARLELFGDSNNDNMSLTILYEIVALPIIKMLTAAKIKNETKKLIIIPDSYTCLIPFAALHQDLDDTFGDMFCIHIMPSLLALGILGSQTNQTILIEPNNACVVGNPDIPVFEHNGEEWNLGRLPHAAKEAEWISRALKTSPILDQQATKRAILGHMMSANIIHIATHGSAVSGFLAFSGVNTSFRGSPADTKDVLLFPSEVENLTITPAVVVLSSCDSARGTVRADGIMGMGRAFFIAGAQSILSTLWKVPDESAGVFMQFFYQYLGEDGLSTTQALQKAVCSLRCFRKYSHYVHWGAYQLCGKEMVMDLKTKANDVLLEQRLGPKVAFPRHDVVKKLELSLLDTTTSSNVQILWGCSGSKPSEVAISFIYSFDNRFEGGIYWIDGNFSEGVEASFQNILKVLQEKTFQHFSEDHQSLVVLDNIESMQPILDSPSGSLLLGFLKHQNTCIIAITRCCNCPVKLQQDIDQHLSRGSTVHEIFPLPQNLAMQRLVYELVRVQVPVAQKDQTVLEECVDHAYGSPDLLNLTASVLIKSYENHSKLQGCVEPHRESNVSSSLRFDSEQVVTHLVEQCSLSTRELLALYCLSGLSTAPIPLCVVRTLIDTLSDCGMRETSLLDKLGTLRLVSRYPQYVILNKELTEEIKMEPLYYVPRTLSTALWNHTMSDEDKRMSLTVGTQFRELYNYIRFIPNPSFNCNASITFIAWDTYYALPDGTTIDTTTPDLQTRPLWVVVVPVNNAPKLL